MTKTYHFTNPLDLMEMYFDTQEDAETAARTYIGVEAAFGDDVTSIIILKSEVVATVKERYVTPL